MFLIPFISNAAQPHLLDRFKQNLTKSCKLVVLFCTVKTEFKNIAPDRLRMQITNLNVNGLVIELKSGFKGCCGDLIS